VTPTARKRLPGQWPMGLAWVLWALTLLSLPMVVWLDQLLRQAGLAELSPLQAANLLWILAGVSAATVGAVLASRRPSHPVGWLLLVVGLSDQFDGLISNYVHYGVMGRSGGLPAASYLSGFYNSGTVVMVACISFIALLTPTGSLPSPRWRWWARVVATATAEARPEGRTGDGHAGPLEQRASDTGRRARQSRRSQAVRTVAPKMRRFG
jgi:hypothetical protein